MKQPEQLQQAGGQREGSCNQRKCSKPTSKAKNPAHVMQEMSQETKSDVLGSYTGTPADGGDPVQDADDL